MGRETRVTFETDYSREEVAMLPEVIAGDSLQGIRIGARIILPHSPAPSFFR